MPDEPEPLPPGGYNDHDLPKQGHPGRLRCSVCDHPRRLVRGLWMCPRCDLNHDQD